MADTPMDVDADGILEVRGKVRGSGADARNKAVNTVAVRGERLLVTASRVRSDVIGESV